MKKDDKRRSSNLVTQKSFKVKMKNIAEETNSQANISKDYSIDNSMSLQNSSMVSDARKEFSSSLIGNIPNNTILSTVSRLDESINKTMKDSIIKESPNKVFKLVIN